MMDAGEGEPMMRLQTHSRKLYGDWQLRTLLADQGRQDVESYEMRRVARRFMETVSTGTREGEVIAQ
jgi:hypothetical protein